jgi:SAM-dependent methyltransferase
MARSIKRVLLNSGIFDGTETRDARAIRAIDEAVVLDLSRHQFAHAIPAYLLDQNYLFLDWNLAFDEIVARPLGLRRGAHATEFVTRLSNSDEVIARAMRVFVPGHVPTTDFETLLFPSEKYGLVRFHKLASQLLDARGNKRGWAVSLNVASADRPELLWGDLRARLEREIVWHQYAVARDELLAAHPDGAWTLDRLVDAARRATSVLDLGSGQGELTRRLLAQRARTHATWAQEDNAGLLLGFAQRLGEQRERVTLVKDAIDRLGDFPDGFFEAIVSFDGLFRGEDTAALFAQAARVLVPGGTLAVAVRAPGTALDDLVPPSGDAARADQAPALELARLEMERLLPEVAARCPAPTPQEVGRAVDAAGLAISEITTGGPLTLVVAIAPRREDTLLSDANLLPLLQAPPDTKRFFWWPSQELRARKLESSARAIEIVRRLGEPESPLLLEMDKALGNVAQMLEPSFWDGYFRAYDLLVTYNASYRELLAIAHEHLPLVGTVLDLGAGTGNFALSLAARAPGRAFVLFDQSRTGLDLAAAKFCGIGRERDRAPRILVGSLLDDDPFPRADGAVLNNVLYSIPALADKRKILARIHGSLAPGGRLFLNDPLPTTADAGVFRESFLHLVLGAIVQGSPMTEFDLAVLTAANLRLTVSEGKEDQSLFLDPTALEALAAEVGFRMASTRPTYVGISQAYLLYK